MKVDYYLDVLWENGFRLKRIGDVGYVVEYTNEYVGIGEVPLYKDLPENMLERYLLTGDSILEVAEKACQKLELVDRENKN